MLNSNPANAKIKKLKLNNIKSSFVTPINTLIQYKIIQVNSAIIIVFRKFVLLQAKIPRINQNNNIKKFIQFCNFVINNYSSTVLLQSKIT